MHVSVAEALTALVSKYIDCVRAVPQEEVENFFSTLVGRARVRDAINALQAARELGFVHVGGKVMLQAADVRAPQVPHSLRSKPFSDDNPPSVRPGKPLVERRPRRTSRPSRPVSPRQENKHEWPSHANWSSRLTVLPAPVRAPLPRVSPGSSATSTSKAEPCIAPLLSRRWSIRSRSKIPEPCAVLLTAPTFNLSLSRKGTACCSTVATFRSAFAKEM